MNRSTATRLLHPGLATAVALLSITLLPGARAAEPAAAGEVGAFCQGMEQELQKDKADLKVQDELLATQLDALNSAPQDRKLAQITTLLTTMVNQRIAMDVRRQKTQDDMMAHMMRHMQQGKESMAGCPMMRDMMGMPGMKGMDAKPAMDMDGKPVEVPKTPK